jgi:hypothetical protein
LPRHLESASDIWVAWSRSWAVDFDESGGLRHSQRCGTRDAAASEIEIEIEVEIEVAASVAND